MRKKNTYTQVHKLMHTCVNLNAYAREVRKPFCFLLFLFLVRNYINIGEFLDQKRTHVFFSVNRRLNEIRKIAQQKVIQSILNVMIGVVSIQQ